MRKSQGFRGWAIVASILACGALQSAGKAAPRMSAYFAKGFDDAAYQKAAVDKVLKGWSAPAPLPAPGKKTVVISKIRRDGKLLELYFNLKTGNEAWDAAAEKAVLKAAPFAPVPKSYGSDILEVHWHFEVGGP